MRSVIFVFLDGIGLGASDAHNPFWSAETPFLHRLLGGPLVAGINVRRRGGALPLLCWGIDATLDITHEVTALHFHPDLAPIPAIEAGRRLSCLASEYHLVLYESFLTDLAGHRRLPWAPEWAIRHVDGFLAGVLEARPVEATIVVCSDHGNLEDGTFKGHTTNPVLLLVVGPGAKDRLWDRVHAITDVPQAILAWLS